MQQLKISQSVTARTKTVERYLRDVNTYPMVTPEEEAELAMRIQEGDDAAYKRLVEANLRFVVSCAKAYQNQGLELCDLINEGNLGLMKAAIRFDATKGFKFISYAVWWIRQQIMSALSEQGHIVRLPANQMGVVTKLNKARSRFLQENEREPSDAELAEFMDITPDKLAELNQASSHALSFDTPIGEDEDGTLLDIVPDSTATMADEDLGKESLHDDLVGVMQILSPREREIVYLSFGLGGREMSLEEIGEKFSLTRERVRQVKERAVNKLSRSSAKRILAQYL